MGILDMVFLDRNTSFSVGNEIGKNVIIFGVDMSSSIKIDNRKKRHFNSWYRTYARNREYA